MRFNGKKISDLKRSKLAFLISLFFSVFFSSQLLAGSWSSETISGMDVKLYVPTTSPKLDNKRALMISLHGCAQTNQEMKDGNNWQAVADEYGMVVALPGAPNGGVILGCWDYYDQNHSRSNRHNDNLIGLANNLKNRGSLNIDPRQIYISGLSSGGGQTAVMGCLAPDVFAGIGINAGPTIGTSSGQISYVATNQNSAKSLCNQFAGSNAQYLQSQLTSVVDGSSDFTVAQGYGDLNAAVMADIYGASKQSGTNSIDVGGTEERWFRNGVKVVQRISVAGMGHAWPAGQGTSGGGSYIDHSTINYPAVLAEFFFCANQRVPGDRGDCDVGNGSGGGDNGGGDGGGDNSGGGDNGGGSDLYCGTDTNGNHHSAGRAIMNGVPPYENYSAVGSYQWLGYASQSKTLQETSAGFFEIVGSCP